MKRTALLVGLLIARSASGEALCVLCPDPAEGAVTLSAGVAAVDDVDPWRGSRLPWVDDGAYPQLGLDYRGGNREGQRLDSRLAVDSDTDYFWDVGGGRQGSWTVDLSTRGYGIRAAGGARTPFDAVSKDKLILPESWTTGPTTEQMPDLGAGLQPVEIGSDHRDTQLVIDSRVAPRWRLNASAIERKVEGERAIGAVIGSNNRNGGAVILPAPVNHTTRNLELRSDYIGGEDTVSLALRFSEFRNDQQRLSWDNPYSEASRAPRGAMALAPENQFLQLDLSGAHRFSAASQLSFQVAYGRATQDQRFEPYTVNPSQAILTLPRDSLNGERNTWVATARYAHRFDSELVLDIDYRYEDLDNVTEQDLYSYVIGDFRVSTGMPRSNLGYDFARQELGTRLAYPLTPAIRLQGGVDLSRTDRSDREVEHADELELWGNLRWRFGAASTLALRGERGYRRGDEYGMVPGIEPPENPLLRRYSLADQDRWSVQLTASHPLTERLTLGAQLRSSRIEYPDTQIGLSDTDEASASLDVSYSPDGRWSAALFTSFDRFDSRQYGSAAFAAADWEAEIEDSAVTIGGNFNWHPLDGRWEHSLELSRVEGQSDIAVNADPFPEIGADLLRFVSRSRYRVNDTLSGVFEIWYERYHEDDWALQGVAPDSVARVLSLGEDVRDHDAVAAVLSLRYLF